MIIVMMMWIYGTMRIEYKMDYWAINGSSMKTSMIMIGYSDASISTLMIWYYIGINQRIP